MKINFIIISILFIYHSCSNYKYTFEYNPQKLQLNDTIPTKSLDLVETKSIQENKYLILSQINSVDFNFNSSEFLVTDIINKTINIYDYFTGNVIRFLKANTDLTDSVAFSNKIPCNNPYLGREDYEKHKSINIRYLRYNEYDSYGLTLNDFKFLKNQFCIAKYIDKNNIYILTLIYAFSLADYLIKGLDNTSAIVMLDSHLKIRKVVVLENYLSAYAGPWNFSYFPLEKQFVVTSSNNIREDYENKTDSLIALASYNENGNLIKPIAFLSNNYLENYLGLNTRDWKPSLIQLDTSNFMAFPVDLNIYNFKNELKFKLYNLPYSNDSGFRMIKELKISNHYEELRRTPDKLLKLFPIEIINLLKANSNILIQLAIYDSSVAGKFYYILQEYNKSGILLSQTNLYNEPDKMIKYIAFDNFNNYLVIFYKSKKGWTFEKRKWL